MYLRSRYVFSDRDFCLYSEQLPMAAPVFGECSHTFHMHCILKWLEGDDKTLCPMCKRKWGKLEVVGSRQHALTIVRNEPLIFHLTFLVLIHSQSLRQNAHIRQNWMLRRKQRLNNDKNSSSSRELLLHDALLSIALAADTCSLYLYYFALAISLCNLFIGICRKETLLFEREMTRRMIDV